MMLIACHKLLCSSLLIFCILSDFVCNASRVEDERVYQNLYAENICFRRFNRTHQFGCQSSASGNVGTIHVFGKDSFEADLKFVLESGPNAPYVPCIGNLEFVTKATLLDFTGKPDRIAGVIVFPSDTSQFTADDDCPNANFGSYVNSTEYGHCKKGKWNPNGGRLGMIHLDLSYPVFLINDPANITAITSCYEKFNKNVFMANGGSVNDPRCSAQLTSRMIGARSSHTCISRSLQGMDSIFGGSVSFCSRMAGINVFANLFELNNEHALRPNSTIIVSARLDSFSLFDNISPGADSALTAVITLLAVADTLAQQRQAGHLNNTTDNVLFSLFDGEAFDYIGSGRTVYELNKKDGLSLMHLGKFQPVFTGEHIKSIIELNQLASYKNDYSYYLHSDPLTSVGTNYNETKKMIGLFIKYSQQTMLQIRQTPVNSPLPPSSAQSFLSNGIQVPAVVLTNHVKEYRNQFYNSFLDNADNIQYTNDENKRTFVKYIKELSLTTSKVLIELLTSKESHQLSVNETLISELADCLLVNAVCSFFAKFRKSIMKPGTVYPLYVGVSHPGHSEYAKTLSKTLQYITGVKEATLNTKEACKEARNTANFTNYFWFSNEDPNNTQSGYCMRAPQFNTLAESPVWKGNEPDWSLPYSTWTESVWSPSKARIFLASSTPSQCFILSIGVIITIISLLLTMFIQRNADKLFPEHRISV